MTDPVEELEEPVALVEVWQQFPSVFYPAPADGQCRDCSADFNKGEMIGLAPIRGKMRACCENCVAEAIEDGKIVP